MKDFHLRKGKNSTNQSMLSIGKKFCQSKLFTRDFFDTIQIYKNFDYELLDFFRVSNFAKYPVVENKKKFQHT